MAALTAETANESFSARFQLLDEKELAEFVASSDSENTKKQIKYSVTVFEDYCKQAGATNYHDLDNVALDLLLSQFFAGARNKKGELYSKKSVQSIRYGLQRHFLKSRDEDIIKGLEFRGQRKPLRDCSLSLSKKAKQVSSTIHLSPM